MAGIKKIFLVDDDEFYLQMLVEFLSKQPAYHISTFTTGEKCLEAMLSVKPDVIILDYYLSDNDPSAATGLSILEAIKKNHPTLPVVMLSGQGKYGVAASTIAKGASHYIPKDKDSFSKIASVLESI